MLDIFTNVIETAESTYYKEIVSIMSENEMIVNRKKIFGDAKYIIVIQEEKPENDEGEFEERFNLIKDFIDKQSEEHNAIIKDIEKDIYSSRLFYILKFKLF